MFINFHIPVYFYSPDEDGGSGSSVADASVAAEAQAGGSNGPATQGAPDGEVAAQLPDQGIVKDDAVTGPDGASAKSVSDLSDEDFVKELQLSDNRKAEIVRKLDYLETLNKMIADKKNEAAGSKPSASADINETDDPDRVVFAGVTAPREFAEYIKSLESRVGTVVGQLEAAEFAKQQAELEKAGELLTQEIFNTAFELSDKVWPNLGPDVRSDLHEFIEDKLNRAADEAEAKGIPLTSDLVAEMTRNAVMKARRWVGRMAEAQLLDTQKAKTNLGVKPDIGTVGEQAPVDESKLSPEKLAAVQADRVKAAESRAASSL